MIAFFEVNIVGVGRLFLEERIGGAPFAFVSLLDCEV